MTSVNPVIQFIMDVIHADSTLVTLTDNKIFSGMLREPVSLTSPYYTRVGIEYASDNQEDYFSSQIRDWLFQQVQVKITVITSYGNNENHCRTVVETIRHLFEINRSKVEDAYKITVNKVSSQIQENEQARWIGNVTLDMSYLTEMEDGVE